MEKAGNIPAFFVATAPLPRLSSPPFAGENFQELLFLNLKVDVFAIASIDESTR